MSDEFQPWILVGILLLQETISIHKIPGFWMFNKKKEGNSPEISSTFIFSSPCAHQIQIQIPLIRKYQPTELSNHMLSCIRHFLFPRKSSQSEIPIGSITDCISNCTIWILKGSSGDFHHEEGWIEIFFSAPIGCKDWILVSLYTNVLVCGSIEIQPLDQPQPQDPPAI
ncbi:hypothetical protein NE237_000861 [Protea cynaroides]|uniref:Uncharacterized protein n=1 Tax=Protea cynaroides TaxID=273540 RepID=A0A9Q0KS97_9MAGN|nr:hypothetical protein NE237_000861 [Protea cynaroides]